MAQVGMDDGGMKVPADVVPFIEEIVRHGGCIIRFEVPLSPGVHLICPASMTPISIEWLDQDAHQAQNP